MRRLPILLLSLLMLVSGLARAYDVHDDSGCADGGDTSLTDPLAPATGSVPDFHAAGCCFGSMVLTLPAGYSALPVATGTLTNDAETTRPPSWHSDSPERPPRS